MYSAVSTQSTWALNPVPVYECAVKNAKGKLVAGALAYERAWRCMYYDPTADTHLASAGPGQYQVYTDSFNHAHGAQATPQTPFPSGTIVPLFSAYPHATGCQTTYAEIIGGFPYYCPAYGTAIPDAGGNFVCYGVSYKLHTEGKYVKGGLPYNIAVD
eukprot:NODE_1984_length_523_cov_398.637131_g1618_i0.p1 GENE.NODE_1984_length_523_cov_398.637131_g1618_i0~~NODE_1984_length_523_cov_398.637131_g1618_i0.p1  ORF type:complete len:158 (-),score=28.34 NODE_1984_length_523_cov_398.637131_g1618_i0:42-515(-)